jgi:pilus assembly protein CpaE
MGAATITRNENKDQTWGNSMSKNAIFVKLEIKDASLKSVIENIIHSDDGFVVQRGDDARRADLLVFELGENTAQDFQLIHSLLDVDAIGEVFYVSQHPDPGVLVQAIRTGAKEFFSQPIKEHEVRQALNNLKERRERIKHKEPVKTGQIIETIGSKGGVGTTTVAVNLAVSLAEMQGSPSVALIDKTMGFGEVPLFLEIKPNYHLGEITKNISRLDATFLMNILSKHSSGVYVLPSPVTLNGYPKATPAVIEHLLSLMQRMFDFLVIDGGRSLDETSLRVLQMSDIVLLVSILSLPCLSNTNNLLRSFQNLGYPAKERIKVVANRYLKKSEISLKDLQGAIGKDIFWTIPNDYRTTLSAINQGKPLSQIASKAPITKTVRQLAYALAQGEDSQAGEEKRGWQFFKRG